MSSSTKYSIEAPQVGKTQKIHFVTAGAGTTGEAFLIKAAEGTRYQLADIVTLVSPNKPQIKRKGQNLQLSLHGGDGGDVPDVVIQDYYSVSGTSLQGISAAGEWAIYNTGNLAGVADTGSIQTNNLSGSQLAQGTTNTLGGSASGLVSFSLDSPFALSAIGLGCLAMAAGVSCGGSSAGSGGSVISSSNANDSATGSLAGLQKFAPLLKAALLARPHFPTATPLGSRT